jgi:hypothetical protein
MNRRRLMASFALLGASALLATACGRRPTSLETPYDAAVEARKEAKDQKTTPLPPEPQKPEKDKRFFLDGLID